MTKNNNFIYFDEAVVQRINNLYKVELVEEDVKILKNKDIVDAIADQTQQENNLVAIFLAYIEYARRTNSRIAKRIPSQINSQKLIEVTVMLLEYFSIEELIYKVREITWPQIVSVFESDNPIENMMKL